MEKLKLGQIVHINNRKYVVKNMIEFDESGWIWQEYEVKSEDGLRQWLSIETNDDNVVEYWLYSKYNFAINENKMDFEVNGIQYSLYEKGVARVNNYFGNADVDRFEKCEFIDYISEDKKHILSVEKWEGETEKSIGEKIETYKINITNEFDTQKTYGSGSATGAGCGGSAIAAIVFLVFVVFGIIALGFSNQKIQKYLDKSSSKYEYVTSVTNNVNNTKAKVYKAKNYSTVNDVVRDIITGVPEGIKEVKTLNDDNSNSSTLSTSLITSSATYSQEAEENGVGITTKSEYAYVYKEDGSVYVQISKFKYLDGGTTYHSRHRTHYSRIYSSGVKSRGYSSYSTSARQESVSSRRSSGGGTSSGK